jgi:hypothetical protein
MRRLLFFAVLFAGCSVLTTYDVEGQPCDKNEPNLALSCLSDAGFICVDGFCKKGALPVVDGGFVDAGDAGKSDAGPSDGGADGGFDGGADGGNVGG